MNPPRESLIIAAILALFVLSACQPIQPLTEGGEAPTAAATPVHTETFDASKYENVWVLAIEEIENEGRSLLRVSYPDNRAGSDQRPHGSGNAGIHRRIPDNLRR